MKDKKAVQQEQELRVATYLRVSTEEQAESGLGLDAQLAKVNAMATVKGWPQPAIYSDPGISGLIPIADRPDGARLLDDIAAGRVNAVIVAALDRIGRRALIILDFIATTKDTVTLVSAKESIDTSTAVGRFMVTIMAGLAEMERDTISERTIAALDARNRSVGIKAGLPPYGYRYDGKDVIIHGLEAEVVRQVYELRSRGLTYRAIALETPLSFKSVGNILDREEVYRGGKRGESNQYWPTILV